MHHKYDGFERRHHIIIDADEVERLGTQISATAIPVELLKEAGRIVVNAAFKYRNTADDMRLKHFRSKYGPWFSYGHLPRMKQDAKTQ